MNFPRPLKLIMKASPHDHFSRESAGSAPVPSKVNAEQGDLDSNFLFLLHFMHFPLCPFYDDVFSYRLEGGLDLLWI